VSYGRGTDPFDGCLLEDIGPLNRARGTAADAVKEMGLCTYLALPGTGVGRAAVRQW
jgi:hypothetical protein